ncbi:MAG: thioredoxin [Candidatus Latescibacterota bacterium]
MSFFGKKIKAPRQKEKRLTLSKLNPGTMPDAPLTVSDADFWDVIARFPLVVMDFWAAWCMPCRRLGPVIEALARELQGRVVFGKLDVDDNGHSAQVYRIRSIPSLLVFKNGQMIDQIVGVSQKEELKRLIEGFGDQG